MRIQSLIAGTVASIVVVALGAIAAIAATLSRAGGEPAAGVRVAVAAKPLERSCLECGVVVAVRRIDLKGVRSASQYQVRVRMSDGSVKTLRSSSLPRWKAGDRVRLHNGFLAG